MYSGYLIASGVIVCAVAAVLIAKAHEQSVLKRMTARLLKGAPATTNDIVDFGSFEKLPPPVARYFRHVLTDRQRLIRVVRMSQSGVLRTGTNSKTWLPFTAGQLVVPAATGFVWNAKVAMPLHTHLRVLDSFIGGMGGGRVSFLSVFRIASELGSPQLNSAVLLRYLAEAVWYPTALLPQSGVVWSPIDDYAAAATVAYLDTSVSLEFRFNDVGEVTGIYSVGRFARIDGTYKQMPWEGHFRDYRLRSGMRVPTFGEVGWYDDERLDMVWKGQPIDVKYEFAE